MSIDLPWGRREKLVVAGGLVSILVLLGFVFGPLVISAAGSNGSSGAVTVENNRSAAYNVRALVVLGPVDELAVAYADGTNETVGLEPAERFDRRTIHRDVEAVAPANSVVVFERQVTAEPGEQYSLVERTPHAPRTTVLVFVDGPDRHGNRELNVVKAYCGWKLVGRVTWRLGPTADSASGRVSCAGWAEAFVP